jgi:hypothetical protein
MMVVGKHPRKRRLQDGVSKHLMVPVTEVIQIQGRTFLVIRRVEVN